MIAQADSECTLDWTEVIETGIHNQELPKDEMTAAKVAKIWMDKNVPGRAGPPVTKHNLKQYAKERSKDFKSKSLARLTAYNLSRLDYRRGENWRSRGVTYVSLSGSSTEREDELNAAKTQATINKVRQMCRRIRQNRKFGPTGIMLHSAKEKAQRIYKMAIKLLTDEPPGSCAIGLGEISWDGVDPGGGTKGLFPTSTPNPLSHAGARVTVPC